MSDVPAAVATMALACSGCEDYAGETEQDLVRHLMRAHGLPGAAARREARAAAEAAGKNPVPPGAGRTPVAAIGRGGAISVCPTTTSAILEAPVAPPSPPEQWMRVQLARVFRKYVSPETPVEMLKKKSAAAAICAQFGPGFRVVTEVQRRFRDRPLPDEALCALLWEYKDRGKKGYDLTERLFMVLRQQFPKLVVMGPERAGKDVLMGTVFPEYPKPDRPVDFVIYEGDKVLAVGLARYDSDRGGSQEDDRTGQYRECAQEVLGYAKDHKLRTKVVFLNDGPGLLLGSMWNDYAYIEDSWPGLVKVVTLRMIPERITLDWLRS